MSKINMDENHTELKGLQTDLPLPKNTKDTKKSTRKISISNKEWSQLAKSQKKKVRKRPFFKRPLFIKISIGVFFFLVLYIVLSYIFIYTPLRKVVNYGKDIEFEINLLMKEIDAKDLTNLELRVNNINKAMSQISTQIDEYRFLDNLSYTRPYYQNLQKAQVILQKTEILVESSLPKLQTALEISGFTTNGSITTEMTDEEKSALTLILAELPIYIDVYKEIEPQILSIISDIQSIDSNYIFPSFYRQDEYLNMFISLQESTLTYSHNANRAIEFLENIPDIVGSNNPVNYLLILQNEAEMRASGGLLTSFGHASIYQGELQDDIFLSDMWNLENYLRYDIGINVGPSESNTYQNAAHINPFGFYQNIYGQLTLMNLGCGATALRAQDSGLYPDLYFTSEILADYYDQANRFNKELFPDYDHVLLINENFANSLISLVEPLEIEGVGVVDSNNLFNFIRSEVDRPELSFSTERKAIIEDIANAAKEKLFELELEDMPRVVDVLINGFYAKDISLNSFTNPDLQTFFDKYEMSGRFLQESPNTDYFHLNEAQNCALKINNFMRNDVVHTVNISDSGEISKDVKITWRQPQIYNPEFETQYTSSPRFNYRAWIRIFTAPGTIESGGFSSNGLSASGWIGYNPRSYYDSVVNKDISDNIIQFDHRRFSENDPIPERALDVSYKLPSNLNYTNKYTLVIQKHPGKSWGEKYTLNFNYQNKFYTTEFTLDRDKKITFQNGIIRVENLQTSMDWIKSIVKSSTI